VFGGAPWACVAASLRAQGPRRHAGTRLAGPGTRRAKGYDRARRPAATSRGAAVRGAAAGGRLGQNRPIRRGPPRRSPSPRRRTVPRARAHPTRDRSKDWARVLPRSRRDTVPDCRSSRCAPRAPTSGCSAAGRCPHRRSARVRPRAGLAPECCQGKDRGGRCRRRGARRCPRRCRRKVFANGVLAGQGHRPSGGRVLRGSRRGALRRRAR
jgi:hypothetical protein